MGASVALIYNFKSPNRSPLLILQSPAYKPIEIDTKAKIELWIHGYVLASYGLRSIAGSSLDAINESVEDILKLDLRPRLKKVGGKKL